MATRLKTVQYYFPHLAAALDATTTNFTQITVYLPEASKVFKSVFVTVTAADAATTISNVTARNLGVRLNAVAYSTVSNAQTLTNSGEQFSLSFTQDYTAYFNTNWTSLLTSMTMDCQVNINTSTVGCRNLSAVATITYEYDDTSATHVKTVWIPLDAPVSTFGVAKPGTATATIPNLSTYLPESVTTIRQTALCIQGNNEYNSTTDMTLSYEIETLGVFTSGLFEEGLTSSISYRLCNVVTFNNAATQQFYIWSSVAAFAHPQIWLTVTYEFTPSTSNTILNSLMIPMEWMGGAGGTAANYQRATRELWIQEPATITVQTCALMVFYETSAAITGLNARVGTGAFVAYGSVAAVTCGSNALMIRNDAITLARGRNTLQADLYKTDTADTVAGLSSFWLINYHSGKHTDGVGVHNHTILWNVIPTGTAAAAPTITSASVAITIPETNYFFISIGVELIIDHSGTINPGGEFIGIERLAGEGGLMWESAYECMNSSDPEIGIRWAYGGARDVMKRFPQDDGYGRLDIETARRYTSILATTGWVSLTIMATYHSITYDLSGNIQNSGGTLVSLLLHKSPFLNITNRGELMQRTTQIGDGSYSFTVYDDTEELQVTAYESDVFLGVSKYAVAGTGFDISLSTTAGGATDYAFLG
jgi:hypothetical protein